MKLVLLASSSMGAIAIDPLIAEARRRARRRRLAVAVVLAAGGLVVFLALRGSGAATPPPPAPAPSAADELRAIRAAALHATIVASGLESARRGWAMNGLGLWLTTDAGAHWRTITPQVPGGDVVARIASVQFVDATHGWASGLDLIGNGNRFAMIERTVDGGRTWRTTSHNCAACGGSLSFVDARHGFSLTGSTLFASGDGGKRWHRVGAAPLRATIDFGDAAHGWALTAAGQLSRTTDGGRTWQSVPFAGVASLPQPSGAVAVRTGSRVVIEVPAGNRWTPRRVPATVDPRFQVQFSAPTATDFVLWSKDRIWRSGDAGRTWSSFRPKVAPEQVWGLQFSSSEDGWAIFSVKQGAALVHTTNGGRDWLPLTP
jgi:photosystem II stability/assembly factor-like uncharacterized protein